MSFKRLDAEDFIFSAESITAPAWSGYTPVLVNMNTSSIQQSSGAGKYYVSVYQTGSSNASAEVQFDVAFGDRNGRGSKFFTSGISASSTSTIFGQYQNLVLGDENSNFIFGDVSQSAFYVLSIDRSRYKEKLLPGSFNLRIKGPSEEEDNTLFLTDNSGDITVQNFTEAGRVYQIVSGSNGRAVANNVSTNNGVPKGTTVSGSYGWFLPDIGTIILNAPALDLLPSDGGVFLSTDYATDTHYNNPSKLIGRISESAYFQLNSEETVTSDYVFIRARNAEFNYSENPSFISGSQGVVIYDQFINNPQTYVTTVGLYNDNNDLLAVAKLSRPLKKDFTKEALIRVKLDF